MECGESAVEKSETGKFVLAGIGETRFQCCFLPILIGFRRPPQEFLSVRPGGMKGKASRLEARVPPDLLVEDLMLNASFQYSQYCTAYGAIAG